MLPAFKSSERTPSRGSIWADPGGHFWCFPSALLPQGGNSEELNLHTSISYKIRLLINYVHWVRVRWRSWQAWWWHLVSQLSKAVFNSTLQGAAANEKTGHADTSFLRGFPPCISYVMTELVLITIYLRLYYNAHARGPWIKMNCKF